MSQSAANRSSGVDENLLRANAKRKQLMALKKILQKQQAKNVLKLKKKTSKDRSLEKSSHSLSLKGK